VFLIPGHTIMPIQPVQFLARGALLLGLGMVSAASTPDAGQSSALLQALDPVQWAELSIGAQS
jgi:hypothetical protein